MKTFDHAVCFGIVRGCAYAFDAEAGAKVIENVRFELSALIGCDCVGCAIARNPMLENSICYGLSLHVGDWNGFGPSGETIDDGQQVTVAIGWWERSDKIGVNVRKTYLRNWDWNR